LIVNPVLENEICAMSQDGKPARTIAAALGISWDVVRRALLENGFAPHQVTEHLIADYELPHLYDDELAALTDLQRAEREVSIMRVFIIKTDSEMTEVCARRILAMEDAEIMARMEIDAEQARVVRMVAERHLERLRMDRECCNIGKD
jgi:hypothetical protein